MYIVLYVPVTIGRPLLCKRVSQKMLMLGVSMSAEKPLQWRGPVTESPIHSVICPSVNPMNSAPVQRQQIQLHEERAEKGKTFIIRPFKCRR